MKKFLAVSILFYVQVIVVSCNNNKEQNTTTVGYNPRELSLIIKRKIPNLAEYNIGFDVVPLIKIDTSNISNFVTGIIMESDTIKELPTDFLKFHNLRVLYINHSKIDTLPKWIDQFQQLNELLISDCDVKAIPATVGNLKNLQKLILFRSHIKELPPELGDLRRLKELNISANELTHYYDRWGDLDSLEILDIGGYAFTEFALSKLPDFVCRLTNLKRLRVSEQNLTHLPTEISQLKKLENLNCVYNNFDSTEREKIRALLPSCDIWFEYHPKPDKFSDSIPTPSQLDSM